jgi:hypothetical protein
MFDEHNIKEAALFIRSLVFSAKAKQKKTCQIH